MPSTLPPPWRASSWRKCGSPSATMRGRKVRHFAASPRRRSYSRVSARLLDTEATQACGSSASASSCAVAFNTDPATPLETTFVMSMLVWSCTSVREPRRATTSEDLFLRAAVLRAIAVVAPQPPCQAPCLPRRQPRPSRRWEISIGSGVREDEGVEG
ncbi:hypothetical protein BRADI_3g48421v3 [Brachypodium distachyon]|uniref:Uncharacterized protein n=1 Tax=Brachypodium distachyon TaxID=15368 RepID=A0A2K2D435_BRADI|nr:hypothetical protein BRADI_3g48421v3 [Brachypodium distachyon]